MGSRFLQDSLGHFRTRGGVKRALRERRSDLNGHDPGGSLAFSSLFIGTTRETPLLDDTIRPGSYNASPKPVYSVEGTGWGIRPAFRCIAPTLEPFSLWRSGRERVSAQMRGRSPRLGATRW